MTLKYFATILVIFILLSFKSSIETIYVFGKLYPKKSETKLSGLKIFIKNNDQIISETITDSFGNFKLKVNLKEEKEWNIFCAGIGNDTLFLKRITEINNDTLNLKISIPIKYKRKLFGKTICPICKKTDSVFKMFYINTNPRTLTNGKMIKTDKGEMLQLPKKEKFKQEKYIPKEISKYSCERDNIHF